MNAQATIDDLWAQLDAAPNETAEQRAPTRFDKLFVGGHALHGAAARMVAGDGAGTAHLGPEDTFDSDCGRLLARALANGKVGSSPGGFDKGCNQRFRGIAA